MKRYQPKDLWQVVRYFAKAVKQASELDSRPTLEPNEQYFVSEFLTDMEEMLIEQLVTITLDGAARESLLEETGLDYLVPALREKAEQFDTDYE